MKPNKVHILLVLVGIAALAALAVNGAAVFAQRERPLSEMVLQAKELPEGTRILRTGSTQFNDVGQPINSSNSASFRVNEFTEGYLMQAVGAKYTLGHYLYRYQNAQQAEQQALALATYAQKGIKSQTMQPLSVPEGGGAATKNVKGSSVRFTDPETGGVYYWFIGVEGRTLVLLFVGGAPDDTTKTSFEAFRNLAQQR